MWLDMIHGTIERRVPLNYRVEPATLQRALPRPFRPKLYHGHGVGGVCMIRFSGLRPRLVPRWLGLGSENAAHRIAVEWEQDGEKREGVFIPRRDTNSRFNRALGGRVFPGIFQRSTFEVRESSSSVSVRILRGDGNVRFEDQVSRNASENGTHPCPSLQLSQSFSKLKNAKHS